MYFKFLEPSDLDKYTHLNSKSGNILVSDDQFFYFNELNELIEEYWTNKLIEPEDLTNMYDNIYKILHNRIRNRIKLISISDDFIIKSIPIKIGLTQTGRDPSNFSIDEKLILNICGHLGLFDLYNLKGEEGRITRENTNDDMKKRILDTYVYNQEVLKVLNEDNFKEVDDWDIKSLLYNKFELENN